jgi:tetratricopeptide (TPR) repeat protein
VPVGVQAAIDQPFECGHHDALHVGLRAQALRQANLFADAVTEFEKVLAQYPNETRCHLALGNLYASQLRQPAKARPHYLKVLETDPRNAQADAVRYWLAANPP